LRSSRLGAACFVTTVSSDPSASFVLAALGAAAAALGSAGLAPLHIVFTSPSLPGPVRLLFIYAIEQGGVSVQGSAGNSISWCGSWRSAGAAGGTMADGDAVGGGSAALQYQLGGEAGTAARSAQLPKSGPSHDQARGRMYCRFRACPGRKRPLQR